MGTASTLRTNFYRLLLIDASAQYELALVAQKQYQ